MGWLEVEVEVEAYLYRRVGDHVTRSAVMTLQDVTCDAKNGENK